MSENEETALEIVNELGYSVTPTAENEETWRTIANSRLSLPVKRALKRIAAGSSITKACKDEGGINKENVWQHALRFNIVRAETAPLVKRYNRIVYLALDEMERRLLDHPEKISDHTLNTYAGTGTDKTLIHDKNKRDDGGPLVGEFEKLAKAIQESGVSVELRVSPAPQRQESAADAAIDVTPTE